MKNTFYEVLLQRLNGESQRAFQKRAGLCKCALTNFRRGGSPNPATIRKIAAAFGDPLEDWVKIAKETRDTAVRPGRTRRNGSYLDYMH